MSKKARFRTKEKTAHTELTPAQAKTKRMNDDPNYMRRVVVKDMLKHYNKKEEKGEWAKKEKGYWRTGLKGLFRKPFQAAIVSRWQLTAEAFYWSKALICIIIRRNKKPVGLHEHLHIIYFDKHTNYAGTFAMSIDTSPEILSGWWVCLSKHGENGEMIVY